MGASNSSTLSAQEARHDPDDPCAGRSNAFARSPQALLQLSPLLGVLLGAGRPSGVFWESDRAGAGAVHAQARSGLASAPAAGRGALAVGASGGVVGERGPGRVSTPPRWGALCGGGQY